jgi:hypothetical protein
MLDQNGGVLPVYARARFYRVRFCVRSNYKEEKQKNKLPEKSRRTTLKSRFPPKKKEKKLVLREEKER